MRYYPVARRRRGGVTIVEAALLLSIFLLFLFAVFEYSRLLLLLQISTNAARSGSRYAAVNVDKPSNFDVVDSGTTPCIKNYVISQMGGVNNMMSGFNVATFPCDVNGLYQSPPQIIPKSGSPPWNQATFTERIAVQITGQYQPILPGFVFFYTGGSKTVPIVITSTSGSEG